MKFLILKAVYNRKPIFASNIVGRKYGIANLQIRTYKTGRSYRAKDPTLPFWFVRPNASIYINENKVISVMAGAWWNGMLLCEVDTDHQAVEFTQWNTSMEAEFNCPAHIPMFTQFKVLRYFKRDEKTMDVPYNTFMHEQSANYKLPYIQSYNHKTAQCNLSTI